MLKIEARTGETVGPEIIKSLRISNQPIHHCQTRFQKLLQKSQPPCTLLETIHGFLPISKIIYSYHFGLG